MMITVSLSVAEFRALQQVAQTETQYFDGMESEELLRCFVADLVQSSYSGGSDERMYAWLWIERRFGPREPVMASMFEKNPFGCDPERYETIDKIPDDFDRALGLVGDDKEGEQS